MWALHELHNILNFTKSFKDDLKNHFKNNLIRESNFKNDLTFSKRKRRFGKSWRRCGKSCCLWMDPHVLLCAHSGAPILKTPKKFGGCSRESGSQIRHQPEKYFQRPESLVRCLQRHFGAGQRRTLRATSIVAVWQWCLPWRSLITERNTPRGTKCSSDRVSVEAIVEASNHWHIEASKIASFATSGKRIPMNINILGGTVSGTQEPSLGQTGPVSGTNGAHPWDKPRWSLRQTGRSLFNYSKLGISSHLSREGRQKNIIVFCVYWFSGSLLKLDFLKTFRKIIFKCFGEDGTLIALPFSNVRFCEAFLSLQCPYFARCWSFRAHFAT